MITRTPRPEPAVSHPEIEQYDFVRKPVSGALVPGDQRPAGLIRGRWRNRSEAGGGTDQKQAGNRSEAGGGTDQRPAAERSSSTRSVRSQEKSGSSRPK